MKGFNSKAVFSCVACVILALSMTLTSFANVADFDLQFPEGFKSTTDANVLDRLMARREELPERMPLYEPTEPGGSIQIFVSPNGSDRAKGTIDAPFKTLQRAVGHLTTYKDRTGGAVIYLREGDYTFDSTLSIPRTLSGTDDAPLYISSYNGEEVNIYGGNAINAYSQSAANDETARDKIKSKYISDIRVIDVNGKNVNYGITTQGVPVAQIDGREYQPARWPNNGYVQFARYEGDDAVAGVVDTGDCTQVVEGVPRTSQFVNGFEFAMATKRPLTWQNDGNIWFYGRVSVDWDWKYYQVKEFDASIPSCRSVQPGWWGCRYVPYSDHYFLNIMEELDTPGEMYFDKANEKLYFYPYGEYTDDTPVKLVVPNQMDTVINVDNLDNCVINGINFLNASSIGLTVTGRKNMVQNCTFRNCGSYGLRMNGVESGVVGNKFLSCYNGMYFDSSIIQGSSEGREGTALNETHNFVQNNYFEHITARALYWGNENPETVTSNNTFNAVGDVAVFGNERTFDSVVEYNYFVGCAQTVADCGDIYYGNSRDNLKRNIFRYNIFRGDSECGYSGASGLYYDNFPHNTYSYSNIFVDKRLKINGGVDNAAYNNILIATRYFKDKPMIENNTNFIPGGPFDSFYTARYMGTDSRMFEYWYQQTSRAKYLYNYREENALRDRIRRYTMYVDSSRTKDTVLPEEVANRTPHKNYYKNNLAVNSSIDFLVKGEYDSVSENNWRTDTDPGFVDAANGNFDLKDDSIVYEKIASFEKLPSVKEMGYRTDGELAVSETVLLYPTNTKIVVNNKNVEFKWTETFGATGYELIIANDKDFNDIVFDQHVKGVYTSYSDNQGDSGAAVTNTDIEIEKTLKETLKNGRTYYWKVRAYSDVGAFDVRENTSDSGVFKVGTEKELEAYEEAETYPIESAMKTFEIYMNKWLVEDDGTDHGFGVYKVGTKDKLIAYMDNERTSLSTFKSEEAVKAEVAKVKKELYDILSENAIPYERNLTDFTQDNYTIVSTGNGPQLLDDKSGIQFLGTGMDNVTNKRPLTPKEGIRFSFKPSAELTSWNTINLRQSANSVASPLGCDNYFICFSGANVEVQKIKNGVQDKTRIIYTTENRGIKTGEWNNIIASAQSVDGGVKITLTINGETIIDFLDETNQVYDIGYGGVMWNVNVAPMTLSSVKE